MSMKAAGIQKSGRRAKLVSLAVILVAAVVGALCGSQKRCLSFNR